MISDFPLKIQDFLSRHLDPTITDLTIEGLRQVAIHRIASGSSAAEALGILNRGAAEIDV